MNPVALVTGGGVRVGRAIALGLVESGYDLVVSYNSSAIGAAEVATAAAAPGQACPRGAGGPVTRGGRRSPGTLGRRPLRATRSAGQLGVELRRKRPARGDHRGVGRGHGGEPARALPAGPRNRRPAARRPGIGREHRGPVRPATVDQPPSSLGLEGGPPAPHEGDGPSARARRARQTRLRPATCCHPSPSARRTSSATGGACRWAGSAHRTMWWARCGFWRGPTT